MAFQKEREDKKESSGPGLLGGIALGIGAAAVGFTLYKLLSDDDRKDGEASKPKDSKQYRASNDVYTRNKCVLCDDNILDSAKKLSCDHVIHHDCLRSLIVNGSTKCPKCCKRLTDEDLYCINKSVVNNRANQLNPNHVRSGPGRSARYSGTGDEEDLDNHSNQLNPNNHNFQGRTSRKYNYHPSGWQTAAGIGLGIAAGYALFKAFQGDPAKKAAITSYSDDSDSDGDFNKIKECARCSQRIFKGLKVLQCGHYLHADCFDIVKNASCKCPECGLVLREKSGVDNRSRQLNPNHLPTGPGRSSGYPGTGDKYDLDNHSNQKNPNHSLYQGGYGFK